MFILSKLYVILLEYYWNHVCVSLFPSMADILALFDDVVNGYQVRIWLVRLVQWGKAAVDVDVVIKMAQRGLAALQTWSRSDKQAQTENVMLTNQKAAL